MIILAATPIGNLGDASRRLIDALEDASVIAAEDTRVAARLLAGLHIRNRPRLIALHDHNEKEKASAVAAAAADEDLLVISDAGMPTVSDPGFALVSAAAEQGVPVTVLPGPSAPVAALAVAGLPTDRFCFEGFLPRKQADRARALAELATQPRTMVFFEAPTRLAETLAAMATAFGGDRLAAVCRELTKMHEEVVRAPLGELAAWAADGVRGEIVIVVGGATRVPVAFGDAVTEVLEQVRDGIRLKDAAVEVAAATGHSRRELYQAALAVKNG